MFILHVKKKKKKLKRKEKGFYNRIYSIFMNVSLVLVRNAAFMPRIFRFLFLQTCLYMEKPRVLENPGFSQETHWNLAANFPDADSSDSAGDGGFGWTSLETISFQEWQEAGREQADVPPGCPKEGESWGVCERRRDGTSDLQSCSSLPAATKVSESCAVDW